LTHAGPEQIVEAYYSLPLFKVAHVTGDYQFVNNRGYNRDRGPIQVFAMRAHVEF
jgi:high affinity Mn2+ porin